MNIRKTLIALAFSLPMTVSASGIPTVDVVAIAQMVADNAENAARFVEDMEEARNRLQEMKEQGEHYKNMVDGHWDYEKILNDPNLNDFFANEEWQDIYDNVTNLDQLRDEFGMYSDDPNVQNRYDKELQAYAAREEFYNTAVERNKRMTELLSEFEHAATPAQKEDIGNSIRFEQTQIENDAKMMASLNQLMEDQRRLEHSAKEREKLDILFGEGFPN